MCEQLILSLLTLNQSVNRYKYTMQTLFLYLKIYQMLSCIIGEHAEQNLMTFCVQTGTNLVRVR